MPPKPIVCTPDTCGGSPRIDGTRLTCANVAFDLKYKFSIDGYLGVYHYLNKEDIQKCLDYCSRQQCIKDQPLHYCGGCTLDDRSNSQPALIVEDGAIVPNPKAGPDSPTHLFLGSLEDLEKEEEPTDIWIISQQLLAKYFNEEK